MKDHYGCPVQGAINTISGKWKVVALWHLGFKPRRFAQLRDLLPGISEKVLTAQLRELERDGIVRRAITHTIPPQVSYSLTPAAPRGLAISASLPTSRVTPSRSFCSARRPSPHQGELRCNGTRARIAACGCIVFLLAKGDIRARMAFGGKKTVAIRH